MTAEPVASPPLLPTSVLPRLATPRSDAPTSDLGRFVAHVHGRPWLPWQTLTGAVLGETTADGRMKYPIGVVMVPRQCGKTTWVFDDVLGRCIEYPDYHAAYTAQTGAMASERFGERASQLASTPLAAYVKVRRSAGSERMTVQPQQPGVGGSYLKAFPPRDGALRGSALDQVIIDEAQEIEELLGVALDQTILPTFTTRPRRQLILIGTAGNEESAYLARYLALARGGAEGVAVIEYGATEDDDPLDPAVWWRVHPGLAAGLTDEAALRSALQVMGAENFAREYLNVWADSGRRLVPLKMWNRCRRVKATPRPGVAPVFGVDVAFDRSASAIVACWPDRDGLPVIEIVEYAPGVDWASARLDELRRTHRPPLIVADSQGPVVTVVDAARRLGVPIKSVTPTELATACQSTFDAIESATIGHRSEQPLNSAVQGAGKRPIGDGGWAWGRRTSTVEISSLVAGSLAYWANQRRPARPQVQASD
jgi:hypothetical protein